MEYLFTHLLVDKILKLNSFFLEIMTMTPNYLRKKIKLSGLEPPESPHGPEIPMAVVLEVSGTNGSEQYYLLRPYH